MATEHEPLTPAGRDDWRARYPRRWEQEIASLKATGWTYRIWTSSAGAPELEVDYPLSTTDVPVAEPETVRLRVAFGADYPWFPPGIFDPEQRLGLKRHRNPATRELCVIEEVDWRITMTVAEVLTTQLPKLITAGRATAPPGDGIEVTGPEPVEGFVPRVLAPVLLVPDEQIPVGIDQGAMVVRYLLRGAGALGCALVEKLFAPGVEMGLSAKHGTPLGRLIELFTLRGYGRWLRDPDFDPGASATQTYERLQARLKPLIIDTPSTPGSPAPDDPVTELEPEGLEMILLVVPSERGHRMMGEGLVALLREPPSEAGSGWCDYLQVQALGADVTRARTPEVAGAGARHVVVVGTGALGGHVAEDMSRAGLRRLDLVDGDRIDVATAARQCAPTIFAGRSKARVLASRLGLDMPFVDLRAIPIAIGVRNLDPDEHDDGLHAEGVSHLIRLQHQQLDEALHTADLVIDATANPAATRYLAALRQQRGMPFLHVAATAGAWGGTVFLTTSKGDGCWSCLQHHRADGTLPIPPEDPCGHVTPVGCASPTFTGSNADLASIAHHASRVALHHLAGPHADTVTDDDVAARTPRASALGPGLYVGNMRDLSGSPQPLGWTSVGIAIHPACPLHQSEQDEAATASAPQERTVQGKPPERTSERDEEADGHSPSRAPLQRNQQRKQRQNRPDKGPGAARCNPSTKEVNATAHADQHSAPSPAAGHSPKQPHAKPRARIRSTDRGPDTAPHQPPKQQRSTS